MGSPAATKIKASALVAASLFSAAQATPSHDASKFQELALGAPHDYRAGSYIDMWFKLNVGQYQAPHAAFTEDQWISYGAGVCEDVGSDLCQSYNTYLLNHDGGVRGTDLSWWVVEVFMNVAKADDYYDSNDTKVTNSRIFNRKSK